MNRENKILIFTFGIVTIVYSLLNTLTKEISFNLFLYTFIPITIGVVLMFIVLQSYKNKVITHLFLAGVFTPLIFNLIYIVINKQPITLIYPIALLDSIVVGGLLVGIYIVLHLNFNKHHNHSLCAFA